MSSDVGIEKSLTSFLERIGKAPSLEEEERQNESDLTSKTWNSKRHKHSRHLNKMMEPIDMQTMIRIVRTLDSTSSSGYDGISPALLKTVLTSTWVEESPRTKNNLLQEAIDLKFNSDF